MGPRIIRTLCDVHAHQIFVDGMFNSDPHAGNVLMMKDLYFLAFALLSYHRGFHDEDMRRIGIPEEIGLLEIDMYFNRLDKLQKMDGALVTTQRCCASLLGLAQEM